MPLKRIVVDTNIFIGAAYSASSSSRKILDACRAGKYKLVITSQIRREYERMFPRAIRDREQLRHAFDLIDDAEVIEAGLTPRVVRDDPDDDKFFAAAWAGGVDVIVSNDRGLLEIDGAEGIRVVRPSEFLAL